MTGRVEGLNTGETAEIRLSSPLAEFIILVMPTVGLDPLEDYGISNVSDGFDFTAHTDNVSFDYKITSTL